MTDQSAANRLKQTVVIWIVVLAVIYFGCRIDAALNPWLRTAEFRWWSFLATQHYLPWLSLHRPIAFGVNVVVLSVVWTAIITWAVRRGELKLGDEPLTNDESHDSVGSQGHRN